MTTRYAKLWIVVALSGIGCDDRLPALADGAVKPPDQLVDITSPEADQRLPPPPDLGPGAHECTIGIRVDNCCTNAEAVTARQIEGDACLVSYPPTFPLPRECEALWDPACDVLDCTFGPPESRLTLPVQGECRFVNECDLPEDCTIARDAFQCCSCFESTPRSLVEREPCLIPPPQSSLPEECHNPECDLVDCAACPSIPAGSECYLSDGGFNRCVTMPAP